MIKVIIDKIIAFLYPATKVHEDEVDCFLNGPYRTNAGRFDEPLFPVIERQRTLHKWDWAPHAPEKGISEELRQTAIVETCTLCGATSMRSARKGIKAIPNPRYLCGWNRIGELSPICPATCQETIELMKRSPLTIEERHRINAIWNTAFADVSRYKFA